MVQNYHPKYDSIKKFNTVTSEKRLFKLILKFNLNLKLQVKFQGLVVQSVVSLTSSLRVIWLTVLADSIHNILKFFAEKM